MSPAEGLAAGRAAQEQRHLAIRRGVFREVIVHDQRVAAGVADVLADGAAGIRGDVLHRGGFGSGRGDDAGVLQRAVLLQQPEATRRNGGELSGRWRSVDALHAGVRAG